MQSNPTVACRALVILACLIAIPLAALFGTSLPALVRQLLDFGRNVGSARAEDSLPEPPPFGGVAHAAPWHDVASPHRPPDSRDRVGHQRQAPAFASTVPANRTPLELGQRRPGAACDTGPVGFSPTGSPSGQNPEEGHKATPSDQFTYIQWRLRELGATYYLLETWGDQGQYYRFHARMAVGGSSDYVRHFEATETDPLQAMAAVLQQVERWRAVPAARWPAGKSGWPGRKSGLPRRKHPAYPKRVGAEPGATG